jgi:hypothetical protein
MVTTTANLDAFIISNCLDSRINLFTPCRPILSGENVGVVLGPYNTKFPGLGQQLAACAFPVNRESAGCWDAFLNLNVERGARVCCVLLLSVLLDPSPT